MNKSLYENIIGKYIDFSIYKNVKISSILSRGNNCISYLCSFNHLGKERRGIIKEFLPETDNCINITYKVEPNEKRKSMNTIHFIKKDNKYLGRYLPAQENSFKKLFNEFYSVQSNVENILNCTIENDEKLNRYVVENIDNLIIEPENDKFCYITLCPYEAKDFNKCIANLTIKKRLEIVKKLCLVVDKFHNNNLILCDLKPQNFLYDEECEMGILKLFDFDSVRRIDANGKILNKDISLSGSPFFSAPEIINNRLTVSGVCSDVFSIGAILVYCIFLYDDAMLNYIANATETNVEVMMQMINDSIKEALNRGEYSNGFLMFFKRIIMSSITEAYAKEKNKRYHADHNLSAMQKMARDIQILIEIYENKGVHPEVMLNNAIILAETYKKNDFDECLFTNVKEITEN